MSTTTRPTVHVENAWDGMDHITDLGMVRTEVLDGSGLGVMVLGPTGVVLWDVRFSASAPGGAIEAVIASALDRIKGTR